MPTFELGNSNIQESLRAYLKVLGGYGYVRTAFFYDGSIAVSGRTCSPSLAFEKQTSTPVKELNGQAKRSMGHRQKEEQLCGNCTLF